MFFFLVLCCLCVIAQSQNDSPPDGGLCLDPSMMSAVCTINTKIGLEMEQAHLKCASTANAESRKRRKNKNKNKGKKGKNGKSKQGCDVDLDVLDEFFADVWEKKSCILKEVGWVSTEGVILSDNIMESINSLDSTLSESLADTKELCEAQTRNVTIESMFSGEEFVEVAVQSENTPVATEADCKVEDLDQNAVASIEKSLKKLAYIACVHNNFMTACGNFILDQMEQMVTYMTEGGFTSLPPTPSKNVTFA